MLEEASGDNNTTPETGKEENSSKAGSNVASADNVDENIKDLQKKNDCASIVPPSVNGNHSGGSQIEIGNAEVKYIDSENLRALEDIDSCLKTLWAGLDSRDWVMVCNALNNVRRISIFHKEALLDILGDVISIIVKSLKSPRIAVCKTAIMTAADIFSAYNDVILWQLLLKSSQDNCFVGEEAERALISMTTWISPVSLLPKLQPHLMNGNPQIREKASMCFSRSVPQLGAEGIKAYGIDKLIQVAASQLSDQLLESREAARTLLLELQNVYKKFHDPMPSVSEQPQSGSWESFCHSKLSPLSAQAVLRVTSVAREGPVS